MRINLSRQNLCCGAALALASLLILLCAPAQYLGRQQDDLLYLISSHALLKGSYRLFTSPGLPPLTMITPGFPALLLPVTLFGGENFAYAQIFCALLLAAAPWVLWLWLRRPSSPTYFPMGLRTAPLPHRRSHDRLESLLICLLFASSPVVLSQAGTVMSEGPYLLVVLALLLVLDQGSGLKAGALLLLLTQLRPAGLSFLPAALLRPLGDRRWRAALWTAALPGIAMLAWSLWSYRVSGAVQEIQEFELSYLGHPWLHPIAVAADNARYYLSSWGSCYLPARWGSGPAALAAGALLAFLSLLGCARRLRQDPRDPAVWMLAGAALMHGVWAWQYERYLIPLLPWLLWTAALGLGKASRAALALLLLGQILFHPPHRDKTSWSLPELEQTYIWLKSHTAPSEALSSPLYVRDGFYASRPSLPLPDAPNPADFAGLLKKHRARWILWQENLEAGLSLPRTASIQLKLERAGRHLQNPDLFRLVYENPREKSRVYALK